LVLSITEKEFQEMKAVALDADKEAAIRLIRGFVARIEQSGRSGLKSHLDG